MESIKEIFKIDNRPSSTHTMTPIKATISVYAKKSLILILAFLCISNLDAQVKWGIKGGANFNSMTNREVVDSEATFKIRKGFNAGLVVQIKMPLIGLSFQPELLYISKSGAVEYLTEKKSTNEFQMDYLESPLNIQWGVDFKSFRPYIQISPYMSYAINKSNLYPDIDWDKINRFIYGVGIGAGVEIWKIQISGKYSWSLVQVGSSIEPIIDVGNLIKGAQIKEFKVSMAFLF